MRLQVWLPAVFFSYPASHATQVPGTAPLSVKSILHAQVLYTPSALATTTAFSGGFEQKREPGTALYKVQSQLAHTPFPLCALYFPTGHSPQRKGWSTPEIISVPNTHPQKRSQEPESHTAGNTQLEHSVLH